MKILAILRGIPGIGKSTWIENNEFEPYTLSPDNLRLMFAGLKTLTDGTQLMSSEKDSIVWKTMFNMLEHRMEKGKFTIVDATHTRDSDIKPYEKLCKKYNYRLVIVEFGKEQLKDGMYFVENLCKLRNDNRTPKYKKVSDEGG